MRLRQQRPNPEIFERWCEADEPAGAKAHINFRAFAKERSNETPEIIAAEFTSEIMKVAEQEAIQITMDMPGTGKAPKSLTLDYSKSFTLRTLKVDTRSHISSMKIASSVTVIRIVRAVIRNLNIHSIEERVELEECCIANLAVVPNAVANISLRNCWIGKFTMDKDSIRDMFVKGGSIRAISCPRPEDGNPFLGTISISNDVDFPTSRRWRLLQGAQGYTNIRAHLEKLENVPAANLMRSLELATERRYDRGLTRVVSWFYGTFANYGLSPGRPLLCALPLYLLIAGIIFWWDGGGLGMDLNAYHGWQLALTEGGFGGELRRALVLPLQSIVNPFGLFGVRKLVVAATGWGHILLLAQGLFTDALLALAVIGIRKRFKLQ